MGFYWILAFHIVSFISWFAMLFYMPRLFVYHAEHKENKGFVEVVKIQERKLIKYIGVPAMWATVISGGTLLALNPSLLEGHGFMHAKLLLVAILMVYTVMLERYRRRLEADDCSCGGKFFRYLNELPTLLMIGIVILIVVKPF